MILKRASLQDLDHLTQIYKSVRDRMIQLGNPQWSRFFPTKEVIIKDIASQILWCLYNKDDKATAAVAIVPGNDPTYEVIREGHWLNNDPYVAIHRVAVALPYQGQGLAKKLLLASEEVAASLGIFNLRIDTHQKNNAMQHLIKLNNYQYRGVITAKDGDDRLAYQKLIRKLP